MKLQGIYTPIPTPFDADGNLYAAKIRHNIEQWNRTPLAGYVVCGSTGESVALMPEEKLQLWELAASAMAGSDKLLMAGTGVESVRETVWLTNKAAAMGYKVAMVRTPHYYKNLLARPESQLVYFRSVADQAKIPLMIYNWPQATGLDIPAEVVAKLSEHPNIVAIKESSGSIEKILRMLRECESGFQVLAGSAPALYPSLMAGASGAVLAYASAAPYSCVAIHEAVRTREYAAALDWQNRIGHAATLVTVTHGIPGLKHAMDLNGYYGGPPRLPLLPPTLAAREEIAAAFRDLKG
jgi:4-hydroxy-2-oxoglutarate aldolase